MKQFSLQEYLKNPSRKVVTRDGRIARIICTDRRDLNFPIIALIETIPGGGEVTHSYTENGTYYKTGFANYDLFFAPEKHTGWVNIYQDEKNGDLTCRFVFDSEEKARRMRGKDAIATAKIEWEE